MFFTSVQSVLPSLGLTKRKVKKLDAICLAREERSNRKQELAYHTRPFILCGIPLRRPPAYQLTHTRRNGKFTLDIIGHPRFGLLFGQDRLIPVWVATLAVLQKSRVVHSASPCQTLDGLWDPGHQCRAEFRVSIPRSRNPTTRAPDVSVRPRGWR